MVREKVAGSCENAGGDPDTTTDVYAYEGFDSTLRDRSLQGQPRFHSDRRPAGDPSAERRLDERDRDPHQRDQAGAGGGAPDTGHALNSC